MSLLFYVAGAVAIISTFLVVTCLNAVHALLYLIVSLLSVAFIFLLLGAPFVGALEVIIYAGAIMVLFVFVIMMLNLGRTTIDQEKSWRKPYMFIGPAVLAAILVGEIIFLLSSGESFVLRGHSVSPKEVGMALFGPYVLAVELASFLLLAGLVGAYHLGRRNDSGERA